MSVGERVAALLRQAPRPPDEASLVALGLELALDVERLASHPAAVSVWDARPAERLTPELVITFGAAATVEATGATRFEELERAARALFARVTPHGGARPRLWGAVAFAAGDLGPFQGFGEARFTLPRWSVTRRGGVTELGLVATAADLAEPEVVAAEAEALFSAAPAPPVRRPRPAPRLLTEAGDFRAAVARALDAIGAGALTKVVLARTVELAHPAPAAEVLAGLAGAGGCVRFLLRPASPPSAPSPGLRPASPPSAPSPGPGGAEVAFVGATPELLVRLDAHGASSEAVAGTEPRRGHDASEVARLLGREKDRFEHRVVVEGIAAALRAAGATPAPTGAPTVRTLARVHHLVTPVTADVPPGTHVLALASALHPTPALGGTPRDAALAFSAAVEAGPRGLYSGPLGWFDAEGHGELVVALRAALVTAERAHAFAGAGIVAGSLPEVELAETEAKLAALLGALGVAVPARSAGPSPSELRPW